MFGRNQDFIFFILLFLLLSSNSIASSAENETISFFDYLKSQNVRSVEVITDLNFIKSNKDKKEETEAIVLFRISDGTKKAFNAKLSARGVFRLSNCEFPPLKLNLKKSELEAVGLTRNFDKYKIVTHCSDELELGISNLQKELALYQMYEVLTPQSYQTYSFSVIYRDVHDLEWTIESEAFILESKKELADRLGAEIVEDLGLTSEDIKIEHYHNVLLYQYMVGNTDWSIQLSKNLTILFDTTQMEYIIVPYDFDFTSFVAPSYLRFDSRYGQEEVHDRVLMGPVWNRENFHTTIDRFREKEIDIMQILEGSLSVPNQEKNRLRRFMKDFFDHQTFSLKKIKKMDSDFLLGR